MSGGGRSYVGRFALSVMVAGLLVPSIVHGACSCREPEKPELPPNHADAREMEQAGKAIEAYVAQMKEYRACLAKCITDADADMSGYIEGWNQAVDAFNKRGK